MFALISFVAGAREGALMWRNDDLHIMREALGVSVPMLDPPARKITELGFFSIISKTDLTWFWFLSCLVVGKRLTGRALTLKTPSPCVVGVPRSSSGWKTSLYHSEAGDLLAVSVQ